MQVLRRLIFLLVFSAAFLLQVSLSFALADEVAHFGRIHHGVKIYNMPVGHLTKEEAKAKVEPDVAKAIRKPLSVVDRDKKWSVEAKDFDAQPDIDRALDDAYEKGRTGALFIQFQERVKLWFRSDEVFVSSILRNAYLESFIKRVAQEVDQPAQDATLEIEGTKVNIVSAKLGRQVKQDALADLVRNRLADFSGRVLVVPNETIHVDIRDKDVLKVRSEVKSMISAPITLKSGDKTVELSRAKIGGLIGFEKQKSSKAKLRVILAHDKVEQCFTPIKGQLEVDPVDAQFQAAGGVVTIIPSQPGYVLDWGGLYKELKKLTHSKPPRLGKFRFKAVQAVRTTEKAQAMGIKERVTTHTEYFGYSENRSYNIGLLAETLDNRLVAPGETFAINETTGRRTAAKGYKEAPVIMDGQLSLDYAGGVCNVSTCFFNAVFFGGYPVVERHTHGFYIEHYPPGRDASIDYASRMDFIFKNDTPYYILIRTDHSGTSITVSLYSTNMGAEVSYHDTGFQNVVPYQTIYKDDPTIPTGYEKDAEFSFGVEGREITVYRTVKRQGKVVIEDKFFSHYEPKHRLLLKGTGTPLPPGTPSPPDLRPYAPPPPPPPPG